MGWNTSASKTEAKVWTAEELLKKETTWFSAYDELERWTKDLKEVHYSLVSEYSLDADGMLYRFEFDETYRKDYANASHFQNVIIKPKPVKKDK